MSYYQEADSHSGDKVKGILDLSNYATNKELAHTIGLDRSDLTVKKKFHCFESWSWQTRH